MRICSFASSSPAMSSKEISGRSLRSQSEAFSPSSPPSPAASRFGGSRKASRSRIAVALAIQASAFSRRRFFIRPSFVRAESIVITRAASIMHRHPSCQSPLALARLNRASRSSI
jgi:hypothetical protein